MKIMKEIDLPGNIEYVPGDKAEKEIFVFTISTCQWCKKAKKWLKENNYAYYYLDIDLIDFEDKKELKKQLREKFNPSHLAFPFLTVDAEKYEVGFDIGNYKKILK